MATLTGRDLGERAYRAYAREVDLAWLAPWDDLAPDQQAAWAASARAVLEAAGVVIGGPALGSGHVEGNPGTAD